VTFEQYLAYRWMEAALAAVVGIPAMLVFAAITFAFHYARIRRRKNRRTNR
jgi:hypothetical protein